MAGSKYEIELEAYSGPMDGRTFSTSKQKVTVGRVPDNDICLAMDAKVADSALVFEGSGDGKWKARATSGNTFTINGQEPLEEAEIEAGEIIKVGDTELYVCSTEAGQVHNVKYFKQNLRPHIAVDTEGDEEEKEDPEEKLNKYCKGEKCGAENDGSAIWCWACGRRLK